VQSRVNDKITKMHDERRHRTINMEKKRMEKTFKRAKNQKNKFSDCDVFCAWQTDNERYSRARHASSSSCRRPFAHIIGDLLFSAPSAIVVRNDNVDFVVRLGDVVRGLLVSVDFGDGSQLVENVTLSADNNSRRHDLSANYRYRGVVSHRYACVGEYRVQLTVRSQLALHASLVCFLQASYVFASFIASYFVYRCFNVDFVTVGPCVTPCY